MSPDVLARKIVGPCEFPGVPCTFEGRHPSLCTRCGIAPGVAAAIREAEIRGANAERERIHARIVSSAKRVPIAKTVDFNGFAQSEYNLRMYAAHLVRDMDSTTISLAPVPDEPCACHDAYSGCPYSMPIESDTYDPPEAAPAPAEPDSTPKEPHA